MTNEAAEIENGMCECGQDMDAHAGGFALLHHDDVVQAAERRATVERIGDAVLSLTMDMTKRFSYTEVKRILDAEVAR